ncbi:MAG: dual specificity protein phosphatase family protein [Polyangiaceae bacterium]|nr:dual specificity protein phosphatase family protein [Polyangiaceae bacterium]
MTDTVARGQVQLPGMSGTLWFGALYVDSRERDDLFAELDAHGVKVVWNLQELGDSVHEEREHFKAVIWTPIPDFGIPEDSSKFERDLDRVIALLEGGNSVYVHCTAGHGRTGMALAAILVRRGVPARAALDQVREVVGGPDTAEQEAYVESLGASG